MAGPICQTYQGFATANARDLVRGHPVQVHSIYVTNANAAARYFQLWDRSTALSGGEVGAGPAAYDPVPVAASQLRVISFILPAGTAAAPAVLELDDIFWSEVELFKAGLAWGFSSAAQTYTAGTAGDHTVTIRYREA